jgi:hypothetical protein
MPVVIVLDAFKAQGLPDAKLTYITVNKRHHVRYE